jgi:hypothetical protein
MSKQLQLTQLGRKTWTLRRAVSGVPVTPGENRHKGSDSVANEDPPPILGQVKMPRSSGAGQTQAPHGRHSQLEVEGAPGRAPRGGPSAGSRWQPPHNLGAGAREHGAVTERSSSTEFTELY